MTRQFSFDNGREIIMWGLGIFLLIVGPFVVGIGFRIGVVVTVVGGSYKIFNYLFPETKKKKVRK